MTIWFQIVLIFVSLATVTFILRGIRKSQVQINDSLFWIFFSLVLLVFSVFPKLAEIMRRRIRNCFGGKLYFPFYHFPSTD